MEPILVSIIYYLFIIFICEIGRQLIRGSVIDSINRQMLIEFFGSLQVCACLFENGFVLKHYGLSGFFIALFTLTIVHNKTIDSALADPCPLVNQFARGAINLQTAVRGIAAQLSAAFLSYQLAKLFWLFEISSDHTTILRQFHCHSDLHVAPVLGFLLEMVATLLILIIFHEAKRHDQYQLFIGAFGAAAITCIGLSYTGMYCDPILASAKMFGCKGVHLGEHLLVYWAGPIAGHILSSTTFRI